MFKSFVVIVRSQKMSFALNTVHKKKCKPHDILSYKLLLLVLLVGTSVTVCANMTVSNAQVKEHARVIHLRDVHCIISFQSLEECYVINNWAIKVKF